MSAASDGLEGIVAAETVLSHVDGERGRLILRGHEIDDLAGRISQDLELLPRHPSFVLAYRSGFAAPILHERCRFRNLDSSVPMM